MALLVVSATVMQHALLQSSEILGKVQNTAENFLRRMNLLAKLTIHYIPERYLQLFLGLWGFPFSAP